MMERLRRELARIKVEMTAKLVADVLIMAI